MKKKEKRGREEKTVRQRRQAVPNLSHWGLPSPAEAPDRVKWRDEPSCYALFEFLTENYEI